MKFCSHISGTSVLYLLWTFSIITGSRSWIHFFLPFSKGQGNMKLQKSSSLCHIGVSPEGNMAVVFLMPFFPPPPFQYTVLGTSGDSSHSNTLSHGSFWEVASDEYWQHLKRFQPPQHTRDEQGNEQGGLNCNAWPHPGFSGSGAAWSQSTVLGKRMHGCCYIVNIMRRYSAWFNIPISVLSKPQLKKLRWAGLNTV